MPEGPTSLVVLDAERHHLVAVLTPDEPARDWKVEDVTVTEPGVIKRAIGAAAIGNVTEWYDFGVYAYFEPTIQKVFFSNLSDTMGTIATFATFAVAFLVRPFGGLFFGPLADRIGRNKVLATTMILMALGTFAIGCIPSAATIGVSRRSCCCSPGSSRASPPAGSTATR